MDISCNGDKVTQLIDKIVFDELRFYEYFIANISHHLLKKVPEDWDGNFNIPGLISILKELYNSCFSIEDKEERKNTIDENNKLLSGLINIFNEKVIDKLQNNYKLTITELPYKITSYIIELPFSNHITQSVTLTISNSGFFDMGRFTSDNLLNISISEQIEKENI
jgi:hypothetical protein